MKQVEQETLDAKNIPHDDFDHPTWTRYTNGSNAARRFPITCLGVLPPYSTLSAKEYTQETRSRTETDE